jgi:hypothetical protein
MVWRREGVGGGGGGRGRGRGKKFIYLGKGSEDQRRKGRYNMVGSREGEEYYGGITEGIEIREEKEGIRGGLRRRLEGKGKSRRGGG